MPKPKGMDKSSVGPMRLRMGAGVLLLTMTLMCTAAYTQTVRESSLARLEKLGFKTSPSLPETEARPIAGTLRPRQEIEARCLALHALCVWVAAPDSVWSDAQVKEYVKARRLRPWLTQQELAILELPRREAREKHLDSIGWKMENMWALAWVLGFEEELPLKGELQGQLARDLVYGFLPRPEGKTRWKPRSLAEVLAAEDLFYCAHNAVRSAALGGKTVPADFDAPVDGGVIIERRHGLTWCLSPGVSWEDTDFST